MIKDVIRHLQKASVRPNDFTSRYSELLDRLWQRKDSETQTRVSQTPNPGATNVPDANGFVAPQARNQHVNMFAQQDEFSWLDLQAVGELVTGEQGFGAVDGYTQFMPMGGEWDLGLMDGEDINRFF